MTFALATNTILLDDFSYFTCNSITLLPIMPFVYIVGCRKTQ